MANVGRRVRKVWNLVSRQGISSHSGSPRYERDPRQSRLTCWMIPRSQDMIATVKLHTGKSGLLDAIPCTPRRPAQDFKAKRLLKHAGMRADPAISVAHPSGEPLIASRAPSPETNQSRKFSDQNRAYLLLHRRTRADDYKDWLYAQIYCLS